MSYFPSTPTPQKKTQTKQKQKQTLHTWITYIVCKYIDTNNE